MKKSIIILTFFTAISCTDNKKIIQDSQKAHADSAKSDSLKFVKLKTQNEKLNGVILDGRIYTSSQLDSIFTGKK
jgi:hypothetical protein